MHFSGVLCCCFFFSLRIIVASVLPPKMIELATHLRVRCWCPLLLLLSAMCFCWNSKATLFQCGLFPDKIVHLYKCLFFSFLFFFKVLSPINSGIGLPWTPNQWPVLLAWRSWQWADKGNLSLYRNGCLNMDLFCRLCVCILFLEDLPIGSKILPLWM